MRKRTALLAATLVLAGLLVAAPASAAGAAPACSAAGVGPARASGAMEVVALRTFHLVVKPDKKVYEVGETAKVKVTVTRPAHEDPAGQGIPIDPPQSFPAEEVNVGMGLLIGDVFLFGFSVTDAEGVTIVKIPLRDFVKPGKVSADAYAWKTAADTPCLRVEENGYKQIPHLFTILPKSSG